MSLFDDVPRRPRGGTRGRGSRPKRPAAQPSRPTQGPGESAPAGPEQGHEREQGHEQGQEAGATSVESVSQLTARINSALRGFGRLAVEGEISRPKTVASGHVFFTLKDGSAVLDAKVWRSAASRALASVGKLTEGARVVCHGSLDVYAPYGKHSLIVDRIEPRGMGALLADLERLKVQLREEGLMDRRRPLPRFPARVGVVTSRDADAWRDFLRTRSLRWAGYPVRLVHSRVQGQAAAREIAGAIRRLDESGVDVVVVCRGGGAIEDLWCFNEEVVARAIWACSVPVVTGVGHESDTTLVDLVADHRAHTPTDAAQTVLPDRAALMEAIERQGAYLGDAMERVVEGRTDRFARAARTLRLRTPSRLLEEQGARVEAARHRGRSATISAIQGAAARLERLASRLERQSPIARVVRGERGVERAEGRLAAAMNALVAAADRRLEPAGRALEAVSPLAVLDRGYSITRRADGRVVQDPSELDVGESLTTIVAGGEIDATVTAARAQEREARGG